MKKILILLILIITTTTSMYAQKVKDGDPREKFYVGPKAGYNISNVYDAKGENFDADSKVGFVAGVFFSIPISTLVGLQPEILFSQKGFQATGTLSGSSYEISRTTNYIDLPVLFTLKPGRVVTLLAGPQFSYLIKQKDLFDSNILNTSLIQEFENDSVRKNTLGFLGGIDFNFNHFILGTRFGKDILKNNGDGSSTTPRYKNVWLQITVAYRL
jgi:hypothetical protein